MVSNLQKIRDFLRQSLKQRNISDAEQNLIILAVDEICSNSIIHGNNQNPDSEIDICVSYLSNEVVIDIKDQGKAFDFSDYHEPSVSQLVNNRNKGSMGLMLVKKIMDKIEFNRINETNTCRLVKRVSQ
jgi:serine/threonine-protein kinase RsbW